MITNDTSSRLIYAKGTGKITTAYSKESDVGPANVNGGKCTYLMRLELAEKGHPELTGNRLDLNFIDTYVNMYGQREGGVISFEDLLKTYSKTPSNRAKNDVPAIFQNTFFKGFNGFWNVHMLILSNFSGFWSNSKLLYKKRTGFQNVLSGTNAGFERFFDKEKTYAPVIEQACKEIADKL